VSFLIKESGPFIKTGIEKKGYAPGEKDTTSPTLFVQLFGTKVLRNHIIICA
jgi:hypothetical protein